MSTNHQKHTQIPKPNLGNFGHQEWAILGTKCSLIKDLSFHIIQELPTMNISYIDADHKSGDEPITEHSAIRYGASTETTDAIHYLQIKKKQYPNVYDQKLMYYDQDLILVNGNHFQAQRQILVIDPTKVNSVRKRLDQLTQVDLIIRLGETPIFDFVKEKLPHWESIPQLEYGNVQSIVGWFQDNLKQTRPTIKGLILAGGKSQRMGQDKGSIQYHGLPQRAYLYKLLNEELNIPSYISCRSDQIQELNKFQTIPDRLVGMGPFGAIISAFMTDPDAAWMVIACDLPNIDEEALNYLMANRDLSKDATCFHNETTGFPDPLLTLFEPKIYPRFYQFLTLGYTCPRKVLINSNVHSIEPLNAEWLLNVNTPEELSAFK